MKFKQVLAGLLVGTMVVTSAPVSGLGALSALAASEEATDSRVNLAAPNISATAPVAGESTDDAVTLDHSTTAQVFKDTAENPATLTSENVAVTKDADNDGNDIQAFSGQITAANDGENNSKLSVTGDTPMVMKFRMKTDAVDSSDTYLMGKMDNQYGIQINSSKIAFYSCNSDNSWPEVNFAVPDDFWGKWHEVVAVYTGSSMKLFVDGKEGSVTSGRPSAAKWSSFDNSTFTMGYNVAKQNSDGSYKGVYNGKFADVAFYSGGDAIASDASYDTVMASLENRTQILNIDAEAANENAAPNYTVATAWTDSKGDAVTTFEEDKAYTLTATLTAKAGYKFTEESKPATIKVGEENVEVNAVVSDDGNTMTLTHTFGEDKEIPPTEEYTALPASALTGTADSIETQGEKNGNGPAEKATDGDKTTFWHSQYSPSNNVILNQEDPTQNQNNNYYVKLDTTYTVSAVTYIPRTKADGTVTGNGYITKCNVHISTDDGKTWTKAGESGEWTYTDSDVKRTITFDKPVEGVTNIKFEVLSTKGEVTSNDNKFINAAEFGVTGKEESEVSKDWDITAPRLSYTAPVAGETAVVPSYVAMEDQSAKPATLEVKDDVPTTVVKDGGVLAFQGRLTAPNNGANNDKFDVSGDTPMVLRTKVKLNNKTDEVVNILGKMDSQYGIQVDGANDRVILYCCDAQDKWPEVQYKYDADTFWGEWHDIALVYTGTNMQLYVDGKAGEATPGRVNASDGYQVVFKSYASSIFTIGYNTEKSTNHEADGNGVKYSTLDQVDGKIADIKLYKGTDYSEGLTKSYDEIKAALEKVAPDADISAIPYTAVTTWSANGTALEKDAKFAGETVYTATTVYTAPSGFKFTDISKPSVDGATVTISADGKTMTVTKEFPRTAKIVCSCVVGEITGVADQTIALGVADSKTVTLSAKAQVTGDCKVEGHDGTVNYTYTVTDAGTTGATVEDNAVTVTAAGTAKVKVTATLASDATKTSTKEITLTVTTNKASAEDKAKLAAEIASVKDLKEADYTEESYADLKNALAKANTLKDKTDVSKAEIEDAIKAISDAKKGLKTKVAAKKEELNSLLTAVYDDLMANGNKYTVASYNNAVTVYKAVKDVPGKDGVTVAELEKAIKDLNDAKDALVLQETADLEKAKENAANTLKDAAAIADAGQKDYEEASWKAFDAAYKALKNAPADADKATLESLTLALRNAQAALKKAETPAVALDAPKVKAAKAKVTKTGVVVNVTVEAVKDAASYDVYRVVKGKATKVGTTAAGKTTVKDKKAVKGASYYAVAVSKDGKAVSKAGAAVAVKLAKAPKIQKATAGSKNAKLSWKKVKGAKVVVYRSTKKNSGYKKVATTRKNATSVTNKKGLKAGKTYYYKIATIKGKLISAMSKAKRVKIKK